jgi:hypothetical protein
MNTSKKIGRIILLKYCFFSVAIILLFPVLIGLFYQSFTDEPISILTFFKNMFKDVSGNEIFLLIQVAVSLLGIWFVGGISGQLIIDKGKSKFKVSVLTIFMLWILLFASSTFSAAIENTMTWGIEGFGSAVSGWLIYGLFLFLILGIIHGLTMGYFMGREIYRKGQNE